MKPKPYATAAAIELFATLRLSSHLQALIGGVRGVRHDSRR